jgi:hypothetical protein
MRQSMCWLASAPSTIAFAALDPAFKGISYCHPAFPFSLTPINHNKDDEPMLPTTGDVRKQEA